ncbi:hypothetical protein [Haloarcula rubripromontorii]|uniref:hypothetical protein n=1 Tax=Haloarcula rubripromontorii TaxID=1705562 RepID=UPI00198079FE|nr:hypothetical protein [Haloarcula rubripromontorii]
MQRRKFLIGLGSLAAGTAAATGTGAFSGVRASRNVSANVASDDKALLALRDATNGEIIRQNSSDQLVIDFTADGRASGINPDSRHQIGTFGNFSPVDALKTDSKGAYNDPAFNIVNQTSQTQQVEMSFDGAADNCLLAMQMTPDGGRSDRDLLLAADDDTSVSADGRPQNEPPINNPKRETASVSLGSGERAGVAIFVDTSRYRNPGNIDSNAADASADLSGTLTISATDSDN